MSSPCKAAGSRPTADSSLVRPPIQSNIGKRASQPWAVAVLSICEPGMVMATACARELQPGRLVGLGHQQHAVARLGRAAALGGDQAERLAEAGPPAIGSVRAMPSGSVLSMKSTCIRSVAGSPSASATNIGPSAEPPMPIDQHAGESRRRGRLDRAGVHVRRERLDAGDRRFGSRRRSPASAPDPAPAASNGRPCASRPGWRWRRAPARPWPRTRAASPAPSAPGIRRRTASG